VLKHGLIVGLAAVAAICGTLLLGEGFFAGAGCCRAAWPQSDPVQAERLLTVADPSGHDFHAQRRAAMGVLNARPADPSGWLRLAYADRLQHGRLTAEGAKALDNSYSVAVYADDNAAWRVDFALANWSALSDRSRRDALTEIALVKGDWPQFQRLTKLTPSLSDANGRVAAALEGVLPMPDAATAP
jgi:hypothetical protein